MCYQPDPGPSCDLRYCLDPLNCPRNRSMRPGTPSPWCRNTQRGQPTRQTRKRRGAVLPQPLDLNPNAMCHPVRLVRSGHGRISRTGRRWRSVTSIAAQRGATRLSSRECRPCALVDQLALLLRHGGVDDQHCAKLSASRQRGLEARTAIVLAAGGVGERLSRTPAFHEPWRIHASSRSRVGCWTTNLTPRPRTSGRTLN